jgi:hypothetical protein
LTVGATRKPIVAKTERVRMNPVTGEFKVTVLDAVQLAFERASGAIERELKNIGFADGFADYRRLHARLKEFVDGCAMSEPPESKCTRPETGECLICPHSASTALG